MSYQVLARKWRPSNFTQMVGQAHVLRPLTNALDQDRLHHAYLFTGTRGVGKTTLARIFAKCLNCESGVTSTPCGQCGACTEIDQGRFLDLIEVDAASRTRVEDTRELLDNVQYAPTRGRYKVYLIDEVHMLSGHSFNALLKTLEEPPPHVKFLLATTDPQKLPVTVLSRCLQLNLKRMLPEQIEQHLTYILTQENIEFEPAALIGLARAADGSMRDALSLLDQSIAYGAGKVNEQDVSELLGTISSEQMKELVTALAQGDAARVIKTARAFAEQASDFAEVLTDLITVLHHAALLQSVPELTEDADMDRHLIELIAQSVSAEIIQLYYQIALTGRRDLEITPNQKNGFEMVMLRMLRFTPASYSPSEAKNPDVLSSGKSNASIDAAKTDSKPEIKNEELLTTAPAPAELTAQAWPQLIGKLGIGGVAYALASNCSFTSFSANELRLTLHPSHEQLRAISAEKRLQAAITQYYSADIAIRIEMDDHSADTLAQANEREQLARQQAAVQSIESDHVVQALKNRFGAQVIPGSIKPVNN